VFDLFVRCLEDMRLRFDVCVYGVRCHAGARSFAVE
jgi:hypothetical protein